MNVFLDSSWAGIGVRVATGAEQPRTAIVANDMIMLDGRQPAGVASGRGGDELEEITMDGGDIPF